MRKLIQMLLIITVVSACDVYEDHEFSDWDTDADAQISHEDFRSSWDKLEYYKNWDTDGDGHLSPDEWNVGMQAHGYSRDNPVWGSFNEWDADGNRLLNEEEFSSNLFEYWDRNDDGVIDQSEYEKRYS